MQLVVNSGCAGWQAWAEPAILEDVPPGGTRQAVLKVIPPEEGATLGSGCHIDVESYINGELIGGIRKLDLPPVHTPLDEPPYAEREITIHPDPPVVGQPAQVCVELYNATSVDQTVDVTLDAADFGIGIPWQEIGKLADVLIPAHTSVQRCLTWTPLPGSLKRCLQIRIQQEGYRDVISQRNISLLRLPTTVELPIRCEFCLGNPTQETKKLQLNARALGLPAGWEVELPFHEITLGPGQSICDALLITSGMMMMGSMTLSADSLPGDAHFVAVEAFIDDELIGGVQFDLEVTEHRVYLPLAMPRSHRALLAQERRLPE
jgi:hypothetical protein